MRTHARLRDLFQTLATLTVAPAALGACGSTVIVTPPPADASPDGSVTPWDVEGPDSSRPPPDVATDGGVRPDSGPADTGVVPADAPDAGAPPFDIELCAAEGPYQPLAGVTTGTQVDYLELRTQYNFGGDPDAGTTSITVTARRGTPCATATAPSRCASELAAVRASGWVRPSVGLEPSNTEYLVYTAGDRVGTVTTLDALAAFVGPVDTPQDAALLAVVRGHRIACGVRNARAVAGGFELETETGHTCGPMTGIDRHRVRVDRGGALTILTTVRVRNGDPGCAIGRRPEGLAPVHHGPLDELGGYFAAAAHLEAASVHAFDRLARELAHHGAPAHLVREALRAKADEVRHAKTTARLASRYGGAPVEPRVEALPPRGLADIALENAVEGCVRETFGALVATVQARRAAEPSVARAMAVIAEDETRHAALAWDVAAWADGLLSDEERARVAEARREAVATLRRELEAAPSRELVERAGVPTGAEAARLVDALAPSLWAA